MAKDMVLFSTDPYWRWLDRFYAVFSGIGSHRGTRAKPLKFISKNVVRYINDSCFTHVFWISVMTPLQHIIWKETTITRNWNPHVIVNLWLSYVFFPSIQSQQETQNPFAPVFGGPLATVPAVKWQGGMVNMGKKTATLIFVQYLMGNIITYLCSLRLSLSIYMYIYIYVLYTHTYVYVYIYVQSLQINHHDSLTSLPTWST